MIVSSNINDTATDDSYINLVLNNMPKQVSCATKEYLCYKAYLVIAVLTIYDRSALQLDVKYR